MPTVYNKVTANGQTLIDLSQDTVTSASHILQGYVGHLADGTQVTGTGSGGGGGSYPWFGPNTTFVERKLNRTVNLANDTSFDSWTASTTGGKIKDAGEISSPDLTITADYSNAYWIYIRYYIDYVYKTSAILQNIPRRSAYHFLSIIYPIVSNEPNLVNRTCNSVQVSSLISRSGIRFYGSTTGTLAFSYGNYGVYPGNVPSSSSSGLNVKFALSSLSARCNSTYFATERKADIDSANTNVVITADIYRTPIYNSSVSWMIDNITTDCTTGI